MRSFTNFKIVFFKAFPVSMLNFDLKRKICAKKRAKKLFSIVRLGLKYCIEENLAEYSF